SALLAYWYRLYFSAAALPSVDLPGHVAMVERLADELRSGHLVFYDRAWFTGGSVFQFYGFLPELVAALLSIPLRAFSDHAAQLAVNLLLVAGCAALPWSMVFSIRALSANTAPRSTSAPEAGLAALIAGTV